MGEVHRIDAVVVPQGVPSNVKWCVADLVDRMITDSKGLYKGTDMEDRCVMFHDALDRWNGKDEQGYIEEKYPGFTSRFIRPVGRTCTGAICKDRPLGNPPGSASAYSPIT